MPHCCDPVVLLRNAALPTAVVLLEVVFESKASKPTAVLDTPVVFM